MFRLTATHRPLISKISVKIFYHGNFPPWGKNLRGRKKYIYKVKKVWYGGNNSKECKSLLGGGV